MANYILEEYSNDDEIETFFSDLLNHGCQSGMITTLIYYYDTHKFYDEFYDEIEEIRDDLEESLGEVIKVKGDLKNFYAWLGFEEMTRTIADELGLEI